MSKTQLFENWTFAMDFDPVDPEQKEFAEYVDHNGSKSVKSLNSCSKYNEQTMGRKSTIHVLTVRAAIEVAKVVTDPLPGNLALGCQSNNAGTSLYICCEYEINGKCYVGVYNTVNGSFRVSIMNTDGSIGRFPAVQAGNTEMLVLYILLVYASLQNNDEFKSRFTRYFNDPDPLQQGDIEDMYCLCDNR